MSAGTPSSCLQSRGCAPSQPTPGMPQPRACPPPSSPPCPSGMKQKHFPAATGVLVSGFIAAAGIRGRCCRCAGGSRELSGTFLSRCEAKQPSARRALGAPSHVPLPCAPCRAQPGRVAGTLSPEPPPPSLHRWRGAARSCRARPPPRPLTSGRSHQQAGAALARVAQCHTHLQERGKETRGTGLPWARHGKARRGGGFTLEVQ